MNDAANNATTPQQQPSTDPSDWTLRCIGTGETYSGASIRYRSDAGHLLEVVRPTQHLDAPALKTTFDERRRAFGGADGSGVWRYRELVLPVHPSDAVTMREGNTTLYCSAKLSGYTSIRNLTLKHEGHNPTASFKDRGMTAGVTVAKLLNQSAVACASTGNTSASMAAYAAIAGMRAYVFIPAGGISLGKLSQALAYGATVVQIKGNFDDAMRLVQDVCAHRDIYLLNSINPFRIEGQKAIGIELLHELAWQSPDWIVLPGGNLGNTSAMFKGLSELRSAGMIDTLPRLAVAQATGAAPLHRGFLDDFASGPLTDAKPETIASAIRIGSPVSWDKCVHAVKQTNGHVTAVSDEQILDAKHAVDASGIGAEPASCASVAGARQLVQQGVIKPDDAVTCILTGHVLKDTDTVLKQHTPGGNLEGMRVCEPTLESVSDALS